MGFDGFEGLRGVVFLIYANEATQNSQMTRVDYSSATTPRAVSRVIVRPLIMQAECLPPDITRGIAGCPGATGPRYEGRTRIHLGVCGAKLPTWFHRRV